MRSHNAQRSGLFFCLVGPAGSGKSSLGAELLKKYSQTLTLSVSVTSRSPRPNEVQGVHYDFVSKEEFRRRIDAKFFLEWEETHGNLYGTPKHVAEQTLAGKFDLLLDIDIRGALHFKELYPDNCINVLLLPPGVHELRKRLLARAGSSTEDLEVRFQTARGEYASYRECFNQSPNPISYVLVNEEFLQTFEALVAIYESCSFASRLLKPESLDEMLCVKQIDSVLRQKG